MRKKYSSHKYGSMYSVQRHTAGKRGIPFLLTYDEWLKIWVESGHLHERGRKKDQYCMARIGDKGPYAVDNVKIILRTENSRELGEESRDRISESRRKNAKIFGDYLGISMTIPQAIYAAGSKLSTAQVLGRLKSGWPYREAVEMPIRRGLHYKYRVQLG